MSIPRTCRRYAVTSSRVDFGARSRGVEQAGRACRANAWSRSAASGIAEVIADFRPDVVLPQHLPPALAVHPARVRRGWGARRDDPARLQAGPPHLPIPRQGRDLHRLRHRRRDPSGQAALQGRLAGSQRSRHWRSERAPDPAGIRAGLDLPVSELPARRPDGRCRDRAGEVAALDNFTDTDNAGAHRGRERACSLPGGSRLKGVDVLIDAMPVLAAETPGGSRRRQRRAGPGRAGERAARVAPGLNTCPSTAGSAPTKVRARMRAAAVNAVPSRGGIKNQPLSILEAFASGGARGGQRARWADGLGHSGRRRGSRSGRDPAAQLRLASLPVRPAVFARHGASARASALQRHAPAERRQIARDVRETVARRCRCVSQ